METISFTVSPATIKTWCLHVYTSLIYSNKICIFINKRQFTRKIRNVKCNQLNLIICTRTMLYCTHTSHLLIYFNFLFIQSIESSQIENHNKELMRHRRNLNRNSIEIDDTKYV